MMKHLNNKGYMLVEIILASVLSMVVAYFVIDLTIKLKNKNDDLLVKTLVATDQAIIYNTIMRDLYDSSGNVDCSYIDDMLDIEQVNNLFKYGSFTNVVSEYASIGNYTCNVDSNSLLNLTIPISVAQLSDDVFDVVIVHSIINTEPTPSNPTPSNPGVGSVGLCGACSTNNDCVLGTCSGTCINSFGSYKCCVHNNMQCT